MTSRTRMPVERGFNGDSLLAAFDCANVRAVQFRKSAKPACVNPAEKRKSRIDSQNAAVSSIIPYSNHRRVATFKSTL